jgi:type I restriction enzyme S subunit
VRDSDVRVQQIPLPSLPEQERIVERIESLFTQLDAGVAGLKHAQAAFKRYKASVLKAACEGRLVPQDPSDEPAEELLRRVLVEKGEDYHVLEDDLPRLPEGWVWTTLSAVTKWIVDVDHKMPKTALTNIPYISTRDFIGNDEIDFENAKKISEIDFRNLCRKVKPEYQDILLSRYGTVGEIRKVKTHRDFQASYSIAIIKTINKIDITDYLVIVLRSDIVQKQISRDVRATAQPDLGLAHIRKFVIPLAPFKEQHRIITELEHRLSVVQELEQTIKANLKRAGRLHQAILKRAFEGRLS